MERIGFIDLREGMREGTGDIPVYLFRKRGGTYEYEKTVHLTPAEPGYGIGNGINGFCMSLPLNILNFRVLKLPFSDKEKLKGVIPFELDALLLEGSKQVVFDSIVLGDSEKGYDILVVYTGKETLDEIMKHLASKEIDPRFITSIELQAAIGDGKNDIGSRLTNFRSLTEEERIRAAMRELTATSLNLRTGPFAYTRESEKVRKTLRTTAFLLLLLTFAVNGDLLFRFASAKKEQASISKEMKAMYTALFPDEKRVTDELYQMKSHMKEISEREIALSGVSPLQLLSELSREKMEGVRFDEIRNEGGLITLKGEASSMERANGVKTRISGFLKDVSLPDMKPSAEGKVLFTIIARSKTS
jgi:type II secretory pathway component PulL